MPNRQRYDDQEQNFRDFLSGHQAGVWTAMPGIVQSFSATELTVSVQPSVMGLSVDAAGKVTRAPLPMLIHVPVYFPRGGGYTLTFPIASGDEALVIFASRNIDGWWQSGGVQNAPTQRMHDLSDGFALVGPFSQPTKIGSVSTNSVQLRSNDASTFVEIKGNVVNITAPGDCNVAGNLNVTGHVHAAGEVYTDLDGTVHLSTHKHAYAQPGGPSPPIAGS